MIINAYSYIDFPFGYDFKNRLFKRIKIFNKHYNITFFEFNTDCVMVLDIENETYTITTSNKNDKSTNILDYNFDVWNTLPCNEFLIKEANRKFKKNFKYKRI